jgi:hypothetical protein
MRHEFKYYLDSADQYYPRAVYKDSLFVYRYGEAIEKISHDIIITDTTNLVPDTVFVMLGLPIEDDLLAETQ